MAKPSKKPAVGSFANSQEQNVPQTEPRQLRFGRQFFPDYTPATIRKTKPYRSLSAKREGARSSLATAKGGKKKKAAKVKEADLDALAGGLGSLGLDGGKEKHTTTKKEGKKKQKEEPRETASVAASTNVTTRVTRSKSNAAKAPTKAGGLDDADGEDPPSPTLRPKRRTLKHPASKQIVPSSPSSSDEEDEPSLPEDPKAEHIRKLVLGFREKASWARSASLWGIEEKDMDELSAEIGCVGFVRGPGGGCGTGGGLGKRRGGVILRVAALGSSEMGIMASRRCVYG
ncbi:hypothetical protein BU26DRAFT_500458 [Trematosphaeria pertusa]|uniref:Uncharacterized protein n=1 Tax=Trematosphaeria pertusa TaxID=390896 RepID=A0A6A6J037_9PLEO|nr:uncharacterized protein BU26DRAFT_500458 [Trematosphaeria pertusa]KAF2254763.1 hypothetical protein BU26DRAFT_500458 [Trematosphaeria pertusa]